MATHWANQAVQDNYKDRPYFLLGIAHSLLTRFLDDPNDREIRTSAREFLDGLDVKISRWAE